MSTAHHHNFQGAMMTEIVLFHHALGLTPGVREFAANLRRHGHTVHVPDLYDGRVFDDMEAGISYGMNRVRQQGRAAAEDLPTEVVYAGLSMGVIPAQELALTRPGAIAAVFLHACLPVTEFTADWPPDVPAQIHGMDGDEFFIDDGDVDAARALVESTQDGELFLYPGDRHLFTDNSLDAHDSAATALLVRRVTDFLARLEGR